MTNKPKAFWKGNELPIAEYLRSKQQALRDEFMAGFTSLKDAALQLKTQNELVDGRSYDETPQLFKTVDSDSGKYVPNEHAWKIGPLKYERHDEVMDISLIIDEAQGKKWPTAYELVKEFGKDCQSSTYSVLMPHSKIDRHTGPENKTGEFIRIHIPLIVPAGDLFLECLGEEITWDDVWGFNNQLTHSAYNNTDEYRLVFLIDLRRTAIGLDPGVSYDPNFGTELFEPFVRKQKS